MKKLLLNSLKAITILMLTASSNHLFAVCQSLIVNGGFETGNFTGWVPLHGTGSGNNYEHIANDDPSFTTGNYALELSFFAAVDSGATSRAYQQVNVPAYGGTLSFKCLSIYNQTAPYSHQTRVYITDVNNNILAIVAQDTFVQSTTYNISYNLAPVAGQTIRIVFSEEIDFPHSLNQQSVYDFFMIDNVSIYGISTSQTINFCSPPFNVTVGSVTHTQPGVYVDTLFGASVGGCDSEVTTTINYQPLLHSQTILYCSGSPISFSIGRHTYTATGTFTDTLLSRGCDSIVTTTIAYRPVPAFGQAFYFCDSGSVTAAGITHFARTTTTFIDTLRGASMYGCDSVVTTVVGIGHTPAPAPQLGNLTLCNGSVSSKISFNLADTITFAKWRSSNTSIGLAGTGVDTIPAFTAINNGSIPIIDTITVTVKGRGYACFPSGPWLIKYDIARHIVLDTINMPHGDIALQCAFSPDGSVVYVYSRQTGTTNRSIYAFSTSTSQLVRTYPYRDQINDYHQGAMCMSPDGQYLYVASSFGNLNLFIINTVTGTVISNIAVPEGNFYGLCISPDGNKLYVAGSLSIFEIDAHADTLIRAIPTGYVAAQVAISPDGKTLFSNHSANVTVDTVYAIDIASGNVIASMPGGVGQMCGYFFSPDSTKLGFFNSTPVTGSADANVFDLKTYAQVSSTSILSKGVPAIMVGSQPADDNTELLNCGISPDGRELYSQGATVFLSDPFGFVRRTYPALTPEQSIQYLYYDPSNHAGSQGSFMDAGHCLSQEMTFTITVLPAGRDTQHILLCHGDTVISGGRKYATAGAFSDTLLNASVNGCDSIFTMVVGVGYPSHNTNSLYICQGQIITVGSYHHSATGAYTDTLISSFGCDSIITTNLKVSNLPLAPSAINNQHVCPGGITAAINFSGSGTNVIYNWTGSSTGIGLAVSGTGAIPAFAGINNGTLAVIDTVMVSAAQHGFVYVPESASNVVKVIDGNADTLITTVPTGSGPIGVAISPDGSKVYVGNGNDSTITVINGINNTVIDTIHAGYRLFGLSISPDGSKLYAACYGSDSVYIISTATNTVTGIIPGMNGPTGTCISPDGNKLYVCNSSTNTVSVINTISNSVTATVPVGAYPFGSVISPDGAKVYVTNLGDTTLSVISTVSNSVTATITVGQDPRGVSASPDGSRVYVSNQIEHMVFVINSITNTIIDTINAYHVTGVSVSPDGGLLYIVCGDTTEVVNTSSNTVIATIPAVGTSAGIFGQFVGAARCSGAVTKFTITVNPVTHSTTNSAICQSALPYVWNGLTFTGSGSQTKTGLTNANGCDSTATLNLTVNQASSSTTNQSICQSALPYVWNGLTFNAAGTQTKTGLINAAGCDSSATLNLTLKPSTSSNTNLAVCQSALPYAWNGLIFNTAGSQTKTGLTNAAGCDSSATLNLTVKQATTSTTNLSVCSQNLPYTWNGFTFNAPGTLTATGFTNAAGCDSTATLNLTVKQATTSNTNVAICAANLPYVWNGLTFNAAGSQTKTGFTNAVGCDSSATLNLTVNQPTHSTTNQAVCQSALPYVWNGLTFTGAGSQTKTGLTNASGCDSTATLNLSINQATQSTTNFSICQSALPYIWNGLTFTGAGSQTKTGLTNANGCDSSATLNLTVNAVSASTSNLAVCPSQLPYQWNGLIFNTAGSQTKTGLTTSLGCDSSATLNLTVKATSTSTTNITICSGALPYIWNGLTFTAAGSQTATGFTNAAGCDSTATLNLMVNQVTSSNGTLAICQSALPYIWNGLTFNAAGAQTKTGLTNAAGCDSMATLNLTVNQATGSNANYTLCQSALPYTWNGLTFTTAGSQTATGFTNAAGCDSTATLNLIVNAVSADTINLAICTADLPYSWNGLTFTATGSQTKTGLTTALGCDSTATLNLTVNQPSQSTTALAICHAALPYVWNGLTFTGAGSQTASGLTNTLGCDSTATLNLTVNTIDTNVNVNLTVLTANETGAAYQWFDCSNNQPISGATSASYTATVTGDYAVAIAKNNCTDTSACLHIIVTGLPSINAGALIEIYPNPNNGTFIVHGGNAGAYIISNELGETIKRFSLTTAANFTINISDLSGGVYFVSRIMDVETFTQKVVVIK